MSPRSAESASFLYSLARRIETRVVVLVPAGRRARVLWSFGSEPVAGDIDPLEARGRALLGAGDAFVQDWTLQRSSRFTGDPHMAVVAICRPDGAIAAALCAVKEPGREWSAAEFALFEFAAGFYRHDLLRCARQPLPPTAHRDVTDADREDATELTSGMRAAADNGELFLLYQPEVDLRTGQVVAVEALTRWLHPRRGELGPESFIALAEESDLIEVLGAWLIEESFRDFAAWRQDMPELDIALRINTSPTQLSRPGMAAQVAAALDRHGIAGRQICVELTENRLITDLAGVRAALADLKMLGVQAAIDDLASGYSSLSRLRALPVDVIKLDRGLVDGIDQDPRGQLIVRSLISLAGALQLGVIAEGVESAAEVDTLIGLGCHSAQGHYFGRPMTSRDVVPFLREFARRTAPGATDRPRSGD